VWTGLNAFVYNWVFVVSAVYGIHASEAQLQLPLFSPSNLQIRKKCRLRRKDLGRLFRNENPRIIIAEDMGAKLEFNVQTSAIAECTS